MQPLRAIVLDNDEATGYYVLLFDIWTVLITSTLGEQLTFRQVLDFFIDNWETYNIFRPDLFKFLKTCVELREENKIDAIIMYTHQNADFTWEGWSVPAFLSVLMGNIVAKEFPEGKLRRNLFDHVLTLPPAEFQKRIDGWVVKDFDRILNLYPWKPRDIRQIIFIDDHATPKHIEADTIAADAKCWNSWYKVNPYRVSYGSDQLMDAITKLVNTYSLEVNPSDYAIIDSIANESISKNSTFNIRDSTFSDLDLYIREKFRIIPHRVIVENPLHKKWGLW